MTMSASDLPLIRSHERIDFKRCPQKWYWKWRKGLTPKDKVFGPLELGTWMHDALAGWYTSDRTIPLERYFDDVSNAGLVFVSENTPQHVLDAAQEIRMLGLAMAKAYDKRYGTDPDIHTIDAEIPLEFEITDQGKLVALHKLKPDLVYTDPTGIYVWLMEHKTAKQIRLEHLVIDDQARPYGAMAELALRKLGLIRRNQIFKGVMYNFLRKALPDEREYDAAGKALNKNGTVSKRQPTPSFIRHPVTLSRASKLITLRRLRTEAYMITLMASHLRDGTIAADTIPYTPHNSCPKTCQFFSMCVAKEQGGDIREMQRTMYVRQNPYTYDEETTDIPVSFEMG